MAFGAHAQGCLLMVVLALVGSFTGVQTQHTTVEWALDKLQGGWWPPRPAPWKTHIQQRLDAQNYSNDSPLIGVLTEPCSGKECDYGKSVIAGPIVEWIHSAGGRVVPIRYYDNPEWLKKLFQSVNGLVFPGGAVRLWWDSPYFVAAAKLFDMAKEANENGDVFPVMGVCLGFELMHILVANQSREELLVKTDAEGVQDFISFTSKAGQSLFYRDFPIELKQRLNSEDHKLAFMAHVRGVSPQKYQENTKLAGFFYVLSTTKDRKGVEYVSSIEGSKYPFFGTQYHPEKPPHEYADSSISHNRDTSKLGFYAASSFVDVARLSSHKIPDEELLDITIYNTKLSYVARTDIYKGIGPFPDSLYFLDPPNYHAAEQKR